MQVYTAALQGRRHYQEDRVLALPERNLFGISDGIGGHPHGDLAAQSVVDALEAIQDQDLADSPHRALEDALRAAGRECIDGRDHRGATGIGVYIQGGKLFGAHVGDSRIQIYNTVANTLKSLTIDHGRGHHLSNFIGTYNLMAVDHITHTLQPGDVVILTTDGIHDILAITDIWLQALESDTPATTLAETAIQGGSRDNCSVVVIFPEAS